MKTMEAAKWDLIGTLRKLLLKQMMTETKSQPHIKFIFTLFGT
jgi:hypothetical protein